MQKRKPHLPLELGQVWSDMGQVWSQTFLHIILEHTSFEVKVIFKFVLKEIF